MKANQLRSISDSKNRRKERKSIKYNYRRIKKQLKQISKKGDYSGRWNINLWGRNGWEMLAAFRLFRFKHKDFIVKITPRKEDEKDSFWDCEHVTITIKF